MPRILRLPPVVGALRHRLSADVISDGRLLTPERALADIRPGGTAPPERIAAVLDKLKSSRVGGGFWAPSSHWAATVTLAVKINRHSQMAAMIAFAQGHARTDQIGVLLPRRWWAAAAAARIRAQGLACAIDPVDPWSILEAIEGVIVEGDDELGLLALLADKTVHCWSPGYLAGWGPTRDRAGIPARGQPRQAWQIADAALIASARYIDPFTGRTTTLEATIDLLAEWRRVVDEDRDLACCAGIAWWKRAAIRKFLSPQARGAPLVQRTSHCLSQAHRRGGGVAVWPSRAPAGLFEACQASGTPLRRIEDGFLRSIGLGSDLTPPFSVVVDKRGIYYDPRTPSDLEFILNETSFSPAILDRADALRRRLVAGGLTKYNVGAATYDPPAGRRTVLAVGQVEDDLSWRFGGADCVSNLDLLRRIRAQEPDAFIIYKPHPDVEAGNRVGAVAAPDAMRYADDIVSHVAMAALLTKVDVVHVLTSLAGFEALLRGREVVVHGQPFYGHWGLTRDLAPPHRQARRLTLNELVAGTLILYPRYVDPVTGLLCSPEVLVERFSGRPPSRARSTAMMRRLRHSFERVFSSRAIPSNIKNRVDHG